MKRILVCTLSMVLFVAGCTPQKDTATTLSETATTTGLLNLDVVVSTDRPGNRSEILSAVNEETNTIMIFGGNNGPVVNQYPVAAYTDETWLFEPGFGWSQIQPNTAPSPRGRYALANDVAGNRAILYAGRWRKADTSGDYVLYNDLWAFDFITQEWSLLDDGTGIAPSGRYYPGGAWDGSTETFYTFGGNTNENAMLIEPDMNLFAWTAAEGWLYVDTTGDAPSSRAFFDTTYDSVRNRLILFAGQKGDFSSLAYNDLYALDLDTMVWEQLHDGSGSNVPSTRMHPQMNYDATRDLYLCFGGHTDNGDMNDLWVFDPTTPENEWTMAYEADVFTGVGLGCDAGGSSDVPADYVEMDLTAPERRHRGMHAIMHDNIWIFGGMHAECSDHLDDTWRYDLAMNGWHEIIEARTGESCARRNDACECLCF